MEVLRKINNKLLSHTVVLLIRFVHCFVVIPVLTQMLLAEEKRDKAKQHKQHIIVNSKMLIFSLFPVLGVFMMVIVVMNHL